MLAVNLTMVAGRFQGFIETQFRADELARFRDLFREMYQHLRGEWHQEFLASGLDLRMKGDGLGHFEMVCIADDQGGTGNKLTFGIDFDQTEIPQMLASLDEVVVNFDESEKLLTRNRIFVDRTQRVGIIQREDAIDYGLSGPNLRGSGVHYDLRKAHPYLVYDQLEFIWKLNRQLTRPGTFEDFVDVGC